MKITEVLKKMNCDWQKEKNLIPWKELALRNNILVTEIDIDILEPCFARIFYALFFSEVRSWAWNREADALNNIMCLYYCSITVV